MRKSIKILQYEPVEKRIVLKENGKLWEINQETLHKLSAEMIVNADEFEVLKKKWQTEGRPQTQLHKISDDQVDEETFVRW